MVESPEEYEPERVNDDPDARGAPHNISQYDENFLFVEGSLKEVETKIAQLNSQLKNAENLTPEEQKVLEASLALAEQRRDEIEREMREQGNKSETA